MKDIFRNTVLLLSPKKKRAHRAESTHDLMSSNCSVRQPSGVEVEEVDDEQAFGGHHIVEWNGEATFWGDIDEDEFFDEEDDREDTRPFEEIGVIEDDDSETEATAFNAKCRFIFPPSQEDAEHAFAELTLLLHPK